MSGPTLKNWPHDEHKGGRRMGSIRQYIKGNVARDRKRGSVHSEENGEKCDRCSSFLTLTLAANRNDTADHKT